jgi:hypothetical protein
MISRLMRGYEFLTFPRWYLLVRVWLLVWMTTVPLFHIHLPDTTDRWSLLRSGGAHTVLTSDLPGEYAPPWHDSHRDSSSHIATRAVNSPELGFIVFGEQAKNWEAFALLESLSYSRAPLLLHRVAFAFALSRAPPDSVCA